MVLGKVLIIGAGPGGLTAGMLLQHRGFEVHIFEKEKIPGGRNSCLSIKGFKFDVGPTFLMMKYILDQVFEECGYDVDKELKFHRLSPMYRLVFKDKYLDIFEEKKQMKEEFKRVFPEDVKGLDLFYNREKRRFIKMMPCLQKDYSKFTAYFSKEFITALPHFSLGRSLYSVLGDYFKNPDARLAFTFQSKYLGMSPWTCPGAFGMIPFVEHDTGIYHVEGGLSRISEKMAELFEKAGGKIHYDAPVKKIVIDKKTAKGVELVSGKKIFGDEVIINADFGYGATKLLPDGIIKGYGHSQIRKKKFSCSTFMIYLGLDKVYPLKHHTIVFAPEYKKNVDEIFSGEVSGDNISFYVRNASLIDKTVAPKNNSQLYVLVPVPNKQVGSDINWKKESKIYRDSVIKALGERLGLKGVEKHIVVEKIFTPDSWNNDFNVFLGATFNLAHSLDQMLWLRPHNKIDSINNCYLVGGGTHPGSGLPTIYESGRITANIILNLHNEKPIIFKK